MVGEVVVVFYRLESGFLAKKAEVVDRNGTGQDRGDGGDHREARAENGNNGY